MDKFIKNIDHEAVVRMADLVEIQKGQVVSKTLAQNKAVSVTLFAFDKDEEIGTHDSTGDAMVTVLEGTGHFTVGGVPHIVKAGETLVMPAGIPLRHVFDGSALLTSRSESPSCSDALLIRISYSLLEISVKYTCNNLYFNTCTGILSQRKSKSFF